MKLIPSIAYLRVQRQYFIGYSMPLAGWIGEHLLIRGSFPKPLFLKRALAKLGFSLAGESVDDETYVYFFTKKNLGLTAYFEPENALFVQLYPLNKRLSSGVTIRAQHIEFYDQDVVSIEPAQKLPPKIRSIGINALILEDKVPISIPYWGMVHEDWENELKILVMLDEVFRELEEKEYRCPICFSPLRVEGLALKCDTCGFMFTSESDFDKVLSEFSLGVGEEEIIF